MVILTGFFMRCVSITASNIFKIHSNTLKLFLKITVLDCNIVVHRGCSGTMLNTCGLPMLYTGYYLDQQKQARKRGGARNLEETPSAEGRMTGWVKLYRYVQSACTPVCCPPPRLHKE